jgi:type III pantothenate kinase
MNKFLAIDAGNTNIVLGVYDNNVIIHLWRIYTDRNKLADEYANLIDSLLEKHDVKKEDISGIAVSNVVPALQVLLENLVTSHFNKEPFFVSSKNRMNFKIKIDRPDEIGADLIAAAAAGAMKYGTPCIILDFGTATTLTAINDKGEFIGGAIAPGLAVSSEALYNHAPHLPRIKLESPPSVIGANTVDAMQSGIFTGYFHMIKGLVEDTKRELGIDMKVIATGGLAGIFQKSGANIIDVVDPSLVLDGIKYLYELNKKG